MRNSASSTMGDPFLGLAPISFRRHRFGPMRPTEGPLQGHAADTIWPGQMAVTAIGIHCPAMVCLQTMSGNLDGAVEAHQDFIGIFAFSARMVMEHNARRCGTIPAPIIAQNGPEIASFRPAPPRIKHRSRGFVRCPAVQCAAMHERGHRAANCRSSAALPCDRQPVRSARLSCPSSRPEPTARLAP
jgi:hypothetical protein